jgi:hypothetical protein
MRKTFSEDVSYQSGTLDVDVAKGVARNVKLLGFVSKNGRRYLPEAVRRAVSLTAGVLCNINHSGPDEITRSFQSRFGWFESPRFVPGDGMRGDFYWNTKHELHEQFSFWVVNRPSAIGFSINALGESEEIDGMETVTDLSEIRSIDLVADSAATNGLFESLRRSADPGFQRFLEGVAKAKDDDLDDDGEPKGNFVKFAASNDGDVDGTLDEDDEDEDSPVDDAKSKKRQKERAELEAFVAALRKGDDEDEDV